MKTYYWPSYSFSLKFSPCLIGLYWSRDAIMFIRDRGGTQSEYSVHPGIFVLVSEKTSNLFLQFINKHCLHYVFILYVVHLSFSFQLFALSLVYTYDASISISTRNLRVNRCDASISALCLRLCLCLHRCVVRVNRYDASISTKQGKETEKQWQVVSVYSSYSCAAIFRHVGIKSRAKRQPGRAIAPKFYASAYVTLWLCLSHV